MYYNSFTLSSPLSTVAHSYFQITVPFHLHILIRSHYLTWQVVETCRLCAQRWTSVIAFCPEAVLITLIVVVEQMDFQSKLLHHNSMPLSLSLAPWVSTVRLEVGLGNSRMSVSPDRLRAGLST